MKFLLTGAYGFLGNSIYNSLVFEHDVITLGKANSNNLKFDITESIPDLPLVDMVIHVAGKAHTVPKTNEEALEFFKVNTTGTKNILDALSI